PGGSITAGMAIYDTMQFVKPDVVTVGMGMAASMGQFLLSSGTKGKRYATPHTRVLMHQPLGGLGGTATDIKIQADLILSMKRTLAELIAEQTGKSVEQITADSDRDKWFTATEALEYGLIDQIVNRAGAVTGGGGTASCPSPSATCSDRARHRPASTQEPPCPTDPPPQTRCTT